MVIKGHLFLSTTTVEHFQAEDCCYCTVRICNHV